MRTNEQRDREVAEWNAALASGDQERIDATRDTILRSIHEEDLHHGVLGEARRRAG